MEDMQDNIQSMFSAQRLRESLKKEVSLSKNWPNYDDIWALKQAAERLEDSSIFGGKDCHDLIFETEKLAAEMDKAVFMMDELSEMGKMLRLRAKKLVAGKAMTAFRRIRKMEMQRRVQKKSRKKSLAKRRRQMPDAV